jgi:hypothetical protein
MPSIAEAPPTGLGKLLTESGFTVPTHQGNYRWTLQHAKQLFDDVLHYRLRFPTSECRQPGPGRNTGIQRPSRCPCRSFRLELARKRRRQSRSAIVAFDRCTCDERVAQPRPRRAKPLGSQRTLEPSARSTSSNRQIPVDGPARSSNSCASTCSIGPANRSCLPATIRKASMGEWIFPTGLCSSRSRTTACRATNPLFCKARTRFIVNSSRSWSEITRTS